MSKTVTFKYEMGQKARSIVSGFEGIINVRAEYLNGCHRYSLQPKWDKKKRDLPSGYWFDENELEILNDKPVVTHKPVKTGGPVTDSPNQKSS